MRMYQAALLLLGVAVGFAAADPNITQILERIESELLTATFTARVEVTTLTENMDKFNFTQTIAEFHDAKTGVHSLQHLPSGDIFFFYDKLEQKKFVIFEALKATCTIMDASEAAEKSILTKDGDYPADQKYYLGPSGVIKEIPRNNIIPIALEDPIRGINAYGFDAEGTVNGHKVMYTFYFPEDKWKMHVLSHGEYVPFPLRVKKIIEGTDKNPETEIVIYDFYQVEDLCEKELFRLGDNLQMPFRNGCQIPNPKGKTAPKVPSKFSFVADYKGVEVFQTKEWYDTDARLARCDEIYSETPTTIYDDRHGLVYKIGQTCSAEPNQAAVNKLPGDGSSCPGAYAVEAYQIDNKYFIGETTVRGIPVDIWEAVGNDSTVATAARFYFSKTDTVTAAVNDQTEHTIPVMAMIRLGNAETGDASVITVDIFDFYSTENGPEFSKNFDVSDCQGEYSYIEFTMECTTEFVKEELMSSNALQELTLEARDAIIRAGELSPLQLGSDIRLTVEDNRNVKVTAKVLSPPSYLASFSERTDTKFNQYDDFVTPEHSQTRESCAALCIQKDKLCATALICPDGNCFLMNNTNQATWGSPRQAKDCTALDKAADTDSFKYRSLDETLKMMGDKVLRGDQEFIFTARAEGAILDFVSRDFHAYLSQFNDRQSKGPYTMQFASKTIRAEHQSSKVIDQVLTVGECYRECQNDQDVACATFSVCQQKCILSGININSGSRPDMDQKEAMQDDADCNIYAINYLAQFEQLRGKVRQSGSLASDKADTAGDCARLCRQKEYDDLEACRGFDFCPDQATCNFYDTHYAWDMPDNSSSSSIVDKPTCDHFALKFSADYTALGRNTLNSKPISQVAEISMDQCAKRCSELSDGRCKSLAFCDTKDQTTSCIMYGVLPEDAEHTKSADCTVYMRNPDVMDVIRPSRQTEKTQTTVIAGMSNGGFATLLIFMMAFGLAIGAVGFLYQDQLSAAIGRGGGAAAATGGTTISYNRQDNNNNENSA